MIRNFLFFFVLGESSLDLSKSNARTLSHSFIFEREGVKGESLFLESDSLLCQCKERNLESIPIVIT